MLNDLREKSINSFAWKSAQSICTLGITFIIQLVLARMLMPEDFGIIALTSVFMVLANTIIETSFSSSIIQRINLDQKLISSIFYANLFLSVIVYLVLFVLAPIVADFYDESLLIPILRVQGIRVILSGVYSIQQAFLNRKMRFKALFYCNFIGSIGQAIVGLTMAHMGAGVWALVISTLVGSVITGLIIIIVEPWKPCLYFSYKLMRESLSFSSKVLAIRVARKLFYNIRILVIGRVYDTQILGYFNKGFQFPSTAMTVVDGSLTTVAFTSLSKLQNDSDKFNASLRQYIRMAMFLCMPMMIGMALIAKPLVVVLLTDKWIGCVPFLQIICFSQMLVPLNIKTTAFEALGKSTLSMKIHISSISFSILLIVITIPFSALHVVFSELISNIVLQIVLTVISLKQLNYRIKDQIKDASCGIVPTVIMGFAVFAVSFIDGGDLLRLFLEITCGITVFIIVSLITKNQTFYLVLNIAKTKILRKKKCQ